MIPQWMLLAAIVVVACCLIGGLVAGFWPRRPTSHRVRPRRAFEKSPGVPSGEPERAKPPAPAPVSRSAPSPVATDPPAPSPPVPSIELPPPSEEERERAKPAAPAPVSRSAPTPAVTDPAAPSPRTPAVKLPPPPEFYTPPRAPEIRPGRRREPEGEAEQVSRRIEPVSPPPESKRPPEAPQPSLPESEFKARPSGEGVPAPAGGSLTPPAGEVKPIVAQDPSRVGASAPTPALQDFRRLWETKRYQELLSRAEPETVRLAGDAASGNVQAQSDLASLYSFVGRAKQAISDEEGAKEAFRQAVHWAPAHERPGHQQQLASLSLAVGRRFLTLAERAREEEDERIQALKQAISWLREGTAARPDDAELSAGLERARRGILAVYGREATAMIERQEFHGARRLLRDALAEEHIPAERREVFLDLIASTFAGEIALLAADAVRTLEAGREAEAVSLFQRAETVLSSVPEDAISAQRRDEINRRFWWGYTKLGIRRLQDGRADAAVDPLLRAIKIPGIDPDRHQETHDVLVDACRALLESRVPALQDLVSQGRTTDAQLEGDRLRGILEDGINHGIRPEDLGSGLDRFRDLILRLRLPVA